MGSVKCSPDDAALIDSPRRIPLTDNAKRAQRKLQLACVCSVLFMCAEVVGGYLAGSLAIMSDAAHLLSDVAGFCISLFAIWMSTLPASNSLSFGFQRAEVIGAVVSVLLIWVLTGVLLFAAVNRFVECLEPHPKEHVDGKLMFIVACIGLLVNIVLMQILGHGHSHGGGGGHGHSHGAKTHGHSHGGHSHAEGNHPGHSHGADATHGHSHGHEDDAGYHHHLHSHKEVHSCEEFLRHNHEKFLAHGDDNTWVGGDLEVGTSTEASTQKKLDSYSPKEEGHCSPSHGHYHEHGKHTNEVDQDPDAASTLKPKKKKSMENLNIESAYIHALGDFIQSLGVCIAGGLIWLKPEWQIADPIATFIFSILVLFTTVGIIRESIHILMEGTPRGLDAVEIEQGLRQCSSVVAVHDLHIWSLSAGLPSLSVHLVSDDVETALQAAQSYLLSKGITHTTIQTERASTLYPRDCKSELRCGQVSPAAHDA